MGVQLDIGCSQNANSPKYLIEAHQSLARLGVPDKGNKITVFDDVKVRNHFVNIDGIRYPKESVSSNYAENDYVDQNRGLCLFIKITLVKN